MICDCCTTNAATAQFFDEDRARRELKAYHRRGPGPTTRRLIEGLKANSVSGTLLDGGSGSGILALELLKSGITHATCVDLSAGAMGVAREEARRQGLEERMTWHEGDLAQPNGTLPRTDIVTLDRVVCCYPAYGPLLLQAAAHAGRWLAFSYPRDRWYVRAAVRLQNLWLRITGSGFRAYAHPVAAMDAVLRDHGFVPVRHSHTLVWQASIYRKP